LKNFIDRLYNDKLVRKLTKELDRISYNNKDLIKATWDGKHNYYLIIRQI
jgi:hypothetical protein